MKKHLTLLVLILMSAIAGAQQPDRRSIENSGRYYYGVGVATDENKARDEALSGISEMIAVTVEGRFETTASETNRSYSETATSIIKTYSTATLRNVESLRRVLPDGKTEVFCYIPKEKVRAIYQERKNLVHSLYLEGMKNETSGNLAFALKQWYFGILLLKSVPEENVVIEEVNLTVALPNAINRVLSGVSFEITGDRQTAENLRELDMKAYYQSKPVSLLHYRFWDGHDNNGTGQVRDGLTTIRLAGSGAFLERITLYPQYEYYAARTENKIVEELWDLLLRPDFPNTIYVELKREPQPVLVKKPAENPVANLVLQFGEEVKAGEEILKTTQQLLQVIAAGDTNRIKNHYGADPFLSNKLADYMAYNQPAIAGGEQNAVIQATGSGYELRKIRVLHNYPTINRQATEYLVLDFDADGRLTDLNLCITQELYEKFVTQGEYGNDWERRREIVRFVEKYRTAFHTRDLKTIDLMFADEALILIGRKIEPRRLKENELTYTPMPGQPDFEQIRLTKQDYLVRQKQVFDLQKDIFIDFSTFEITAKSNNPGVYGVQMRQNYTSTTYADEGYLFLLIDFQQKDPMIYIRAWQPNEWDSSALVNLSNFRVFK